MEYVAGRSLAAIVKDGPLLPRRAATYLKTIAEAIHYAHERNILHRDLNNFLPPNINGGSPPAGKPNSWVLGSAQTDTTTSNIANGVLFKYVNGAGVYRSH